MILVIGKKSHENSMIKAPNSKSPISNFKTHFELSFLGSPQRGDVRRTEGSFQIPNTKFRVQKFQNLIKHSP